MWFQRNDSRYCRWLGANKADPRGNTRESLVRPLNFLEIVLSNEMSLWFCNVFPGSYYKILIVIKLSFKQLRKCLD